MRKCIISQKITFTQSSPLKGFEGNWIGTMCEAIGKKGC